MLFVDIFNTFQAKTAPGNFCARFAAAITAIVAVLVLTGWAFGIERLPQLFLGLSAMNPMTAIGLFVCAISVWLLALTGVQTRRIGAILGALVFMLGVLRFTEFFFGPQLDIDLLFFRHDIESAAFPARMSAATATMFVSLGLSLFLLNASRGMMLRRIAQTLAMACGLLAITTLIILVVRAISLLELPFFFSLAPHTAAGFALLSIGILTNFFHPIDAWKNLSIAKKFATGFVVIFVLSVALVFITISVSATLGKLAEDEGRARQKVELALLLENDVLQINLLLYKFASTYDQSLLEKLEKLRALSIQYRAELRAFNPTSAVINALDSFEQLLSRRIALADKIIHAVNQDAPSAEILSIRQERETTDDEACSYLKYIVQIKKEELLKTADNAKQLRASLARNILWVVLFILCIVASVLYLIWRSIGQPLVMLKEAATRIAALDFSATITAGSKDEIGALGQAFNAMVGKLKESYTNIDAANQQLKASNQQLCASNQQIDASNQQLRAANQQLAAAEVDLKEKMEQLEIFTRTAVGRELKIIELKKELEECQHLNKRHE